MKLFNNAKILSSFLFCVFTCAILYFPGSVEALTLTPVRLEISGNPGDVLDHEITLINEGEETEIFYSSFANFAANGETGNPSFVNDNTGLATWMNVANSVSLSPGSSETINVSISIPKNAEPGGYFGAVFWGTAPEAQTSQEVSVTSKTGILILLSVNGEVKESGGILEFDIKDGKRVFTSLPVVFSYRFRNDGGDRVKPEGDINVRNMFGILDARISANKVEGNILPTQVRRFETTLVGSRKNASSEPREVKGFFAKAEYEWQNFALGRYTATISLSFGDSKQISEDKVSFWVFPWRFLALFSIILWLGFVSFRFLIRKYNARIIKKAGLQKTKK